MNNKDLDDLKYLLEKYREWANLRYLHKLETSVDYVIYHVKEDLKK